MSSAYIRQSAGWLPMLPPLAAAIAAGVLVGSVWVGVWLYASWAAAFAVSRALIPGLGRGMGWVLSCAGALMIAGCALNLYSWLLPPDASLSAPSLMYDYERDFKSAALYANTGRVSFWGSNSSYIQALGLIFRLTGVNILTPLCINIALSIGTISAGAWTAAYLLRRPASDRTLTAAALCIAGVAQLTLLATVDLKDAGAVFSFTLMSAALAVASRRRLPVRWLVGAGIAALLMIVFKSVLGVFVLAGAVFCVLRRGRGHIYDALFFAILTYAILAGGSMFKVVSDSQHFSAESLSYGIFTERHRAYESIVMGGVLLSSCMAENMPYTDYGRGADPSATTLALCARPAVRLVLSLRTLQLAMVCAVRDCAFIHGIADVPPRERRPVPLDPFPDGLLLRRGTIRMRLVAAIFRAVHTDVCSTGHSGAEGISRRKHGGQTSFHNHVGRICRDSARGSHGCIRTNKLSPNCR